MNNPKQLIGLREMNLVDDIKARAMQKLAEELMESKNHKRQHDGKLIRWVLEKFDIWEEET